MHTISWSTQLLFVKPEENQLATQQVSLCTGTFSLWRVRRLLVGGFAPDNKLPLRLGLWWWRDSCLQECQESILWRWLTYFSICVCCSVEEAALARWGLPNTPNHKVIHTSQGIQEGKNEEMKRWPSGGICLTYQSTVNGQRSTVKGGVVWFVLTLWDGQ